MAATITIFGRDLNQAQAKFLIANTFKKEEERYKNHFFAEKEGVPLDANPHYPLSEIAYAMLHNFAENGEEGLIFEVESGGRSEKVGYVGNFYDEKYKITFPNHLMVEFFKLGL